MPIKQLDEATKKAINEIPIETIWRTRFEHAILLYGIEAMAHYCLMRAARSIPNGQIPLDEFVRNYKLEFSPYPEAPFFKGDLKPIEADGIFIPQQRYQNYENRVMFFCPDYRNRIWFYESWVDESYALVLTDRTWQPSDLQNPEVIEQGIRFGKDMWQTCIESFNSQEKPQPQVLTELGGQLIEHYSSIISDETK